MRWTSIRRASGGRTGDSPTAATPTESTEVSGVSAFPQPRSPPGAPAIAPAHLAAEDENAPSTSGQGGTQAGKGGVPSLSWVRRIFQGRLVTETQCLRCETTTSREEDFLDLSLVSGLDE